VIQGRKERLSASKKSGSVGLSETIAVMFESQKAKMGERQREAIGRNPIYGHTL
jgi:hypothetical protein